MPEADRDARAPGGFARLSRSLSAKLTTLLVVALVGIFGLLGYLNIRLHRQHLEATTLRSAERVSDVIKRSTSYYMLRNDRDGLYHIIGTTAHEPGMVRIRIFNQQGRISFSTDTAEVDTYVNKGAEACYGCHAQAQPLVRLNRPDRFRIYRTTNGARVLGIINPIENQPSCWSADCHAHPADQRILGVLDTSLSLESADASLAESSRQMLAYTLVAVLLISFLSGLFVWRVVYRPITLLKAGTEHLARGELGHQIDLRSNDEVGELAASFNTMSQELRQAREEITAWTRMLEARVEDKTRELQRAHEHALQMEKMATIGRLGAVVAHEINNPLAGILTYAKLLRKWLDRGEWDATHRAQIGSSLELIETESRRCGEIVKNLLMFARAAPMNLEWANLNTAIERALLLVHHQMELANVQCQKALADDLSPVRCDAAQIEQVLLALVMNAVEAMPRGGNVWVRSRRLVEEEAVELQVRDDGPGIPAEVLPHLFEPFFTTKETGHGVGLGLAISRTIVERHHGRIQVASEPGRGTTFTIALPLDAMAPVAAQPQPVSSEVR